MSTTVDDKVGFRKRLILGLLVVVVVLIGALVGFVIVTAKGGLDSNQEGQSGADGLGRNPSSPGIQASVSSQPPPGQPSPGSNVNNGQSSAGAIAPDYISGSFLSDNPDDPKPRGCQLTPGETCRVRFLGSYRLSSSESGNIVVSAYENGSDKPATSKTLAVTKGTFRWPLELIYVVGAQAETVQFKIVMQDSKGRTLATQDPPGPVIPISR